MTSGPEKGASDELVPYARRAGRGASVWYMGCLFSVLAGSDDTDRRFGLVEMVAPKGLEPSRHVHHHDDEGFYVLDRRPYLLRRRGDLRGRSGDVRLRTARRAPLLHHSDRRGAYARPRGAGGHRATLPGSSLLSAGRGADAAPGAHRTARHGQPGGDGQGSG